MSQNDLVTWKVCNQKSTVSSEHFGAHFPILLPPRFISHKKNRHKPATHAPKPKKSSKFRLCQKLLDQGFRDTPEEDEVEEAEVQFF